MVRHIVILTILIFINGGLGMSLLHDILHGKKRKNTMLAIILSFLAVLVCVVELVFSLISLGLQG